MAPDRRGPRPHPAIDDESDAGPLGAHLLTAAGKVDPELVRKAFEEAIEAGEDDPERRRVSFTLRRDHQSRLDRYLTTRILYLSRNRLQRLIDDGGVWVNNRPGKASTKLRIHDTVEVIVPPPATAHVAPEPMTLDVIFEDQHLLVLNKSADVLVHPARGENSGTLINGLAWHFRHVSAGELSSVGDDVARPGVVHRLDRNTSGCIVFAKDDTAHWRLGQQFHDRTVDKRYLALVHGRIPADLTRIDLPLGPHPSKAKGFREKQVVRRDEYGKPALTICRVRERYRLHDRPVRDQEFTLVELELKTGRTHQIRVHLACLNKLDSTLWHDEPDGGGFPIVGDDMYGGRPLLLDPAADPDRSPDDPNTIIARQALHATLLAFAHPIDARPMRFAAPGPPDLRAAIAMLRRGLIDAPDTPGATVDLDHVLNLPRELKRLPGHA